MNPIYVLLEMPHRWVILAALSFGAGVVGAMASLAYDWPHWLGRGWFYLCAAIAVAFLLLAFIDWRARAEEALREAAEGLERTTPASGTSGD